MAKIFPSRLPAKVELSVAKAFRKLKKLPDEFTLWFSVQRATHGTTSPHFLLLWKEKHAFLIHIADTSQALAETATQSALFNTEQITVNELGKTESQIITDFETHLHKTLETTIPVTKLVLFPNVEQGTIDAISLQQTKNNDTHFLGLHQLSPANLPSYFQTKAEEHLPAPQILHLRSHFTPEIIIPDHISPLATHNPNTKATLQKTLLDLDQEWIAKNNLYLPPKAKEISNENLQPKKQEIISQLVTGVAGSGKSLILLYRALLNANLNPSAKILVLTHNRPINHELERRYQALNPQFKNVVYLTFFQWATSLLRPIGELKDKEIIPPYTTLEILEKLPHIPNLTTEFIAEEIAYIKDLNISKKSQYLTLSRTGRGTNLPNNQRQKIWDIAKKYSNKLSTRKQLDWNGVAMLLHQCAIEKKLPLPAYDCILIDEAQFFAKSWFDTVLLALSPGGQLFLSADPTQGFLKRRQSWIASGIDVRGRTTKLTKAYRNTKSILAFAKNFYHSRQKQNDNTSESEDLNIPTQDHIQQLSNIGTPPEIIHCPSLHDTHKRATNEILSLANAPGSNISGHNLIVLHTQHSHLTTFEKTLSSLDTKKRQIHQAGKTVCPLNTLCQTSTLNAATGLEAPYIFLLGIDHLLEKENNPLLTPEEKAELITIHTRLLYMAFTRASAKLIILTTSKTIQKNLQSLTH